MLSRIAKSLFCLFLTLLLGSFSFAQYNPKPEKSNVKANQTAEEIQQNIEILKNSSNDENLSKQLAKIYTEVTNTKSREFIVLDYSQAIPYLYKLLETNKNKNVLRWTITLLGEIDRKNILPILNENLKTETDDEIIVTILHTITNAAQPFDNPEKEELLIFIPQLIKLLKTNQNKEVLMASMNAIGYLGKDAKDSVPILIDILKTSENEDILNADIRTLGRIGKDAKDAVPYLIEIIKQKNNGRLFLYNPLLVSSIESIGNIGKGSEDAIPILLKILTEKQRTHNRINDSRFKTSIEAMDVKMDIFSLTNNIEKMLDSLISDRDFSNTDLIEKTLKDNFKKPYDPDLQKLYDKIQLLQELKQKQDAENNNFKIYIEEHYILSIMVFLTILMISLWSIFILAKPIWLVSFHEYLWTNSLMANFKYVLEFPIISLVSTICLRPRTIDTWVKSNLEKAKENFNEKKTVKERYLYIPVKILYENNNTDFVAQTFQEVFEKNHLQLLIYGDGGSGKTSLVCQMAKWALDKKLFEKHYALPVLIENNVKDIQKTISLEIKNLTNNETIISDALQKALLRKKRILLIVDGLSELDEETKQQVINNADINAVVHTSRDDEIKDIPKAETNYLVGGMVTDFLEKYIEESIEKEEKEKLFDKTIFDYNSGDLKKLVGEKEISILMAKLYAEQLIAQKQRTISDELPRNVPELMIQSIKVLHEKEAYKKIEFSEVIKVSKIVAYESLRKDYRPLPENKAEVLKALEAIKDSEDIFYHLRDNLKVIEEKGIAEDKIAFKLDPLAEYLAAMYLIEENKNNPKKWDDFLKDAEKKNNKKNNIKGFLVAVKDCYEMCENKDDSNIKKLNKIIEDQTD